MLVAMTPFASANDAAFHGLLRARDLTPFGYLRLDMRPASSRSRAAGSWGIETDVAYQNTWAMSPEVEKYLTALPGRRELGPDELQAIRALPGENYLVDLELSQFDVTLNYQISDEWGAFLILSGASFGGGFLDGTIEDFHDLIGSSSFGRPAAARNDTNLLFDLKSSQYAAFEAPGRGGLLDPVIGVRYTRAFDDARWKMTLESALKIPVADRDAALSTGRTDFGVQMSLQRYWGLQAFYVNVAAVYYAGADNFVPEPSQILPTLVLGYELRVAPANQPDSPGIRERQRLRARADRSSRTTRDEISVERRRASPLGRSPDFVRADGEPAEHQQHARRRFSARLVFQPGVGLTRVSDSARAAWQCRVHRRVRRQPHRCC